MQSEHLEKIDFLKSKLEISILSEYLPFNRISEYKRENGKKYRERLYPLEIIIQAMLFQAINEDKSEQNAVLYLSEHYQSLQKEYYKQTAELIERAKSEPPKRGRPVKRQIRIQKSKLSDVSINTASYNEAKKRLPLELLKEIVKSIAIPESSENLWYGHRVLIADGTNLDTYDNKELRDYFMPDGVNKKASLPIVKVEGLIDLYTGMIVDMEIDNYRSSESRMLKVLYRSIPVGAVILGDDLYSSYSHLCYSKSHGCDIIAQGKHERNDKIIQALGENDTIVEWQISKLPAWFTQEDVLPKKMQVRRITFTDPRNPKHKICIYTTLLDNKKYKAVDIIALYASRWDIEVGFREIKKVMKMEHLRSKSVSMIMKEIYCYWIAYNIIRKIMYKVYTEEDANFFSLRETLQIEYSKAQIQLYNLDKLGRSYIRRSPGRHRKNYQEKTKKTQNKSE